MTVAALASSISYIENGVTATFAVPFRYKTPKSIVADRVLASGVVLAMTNGIDFSASAATTDAGGTVTVTTPAVAGTRLRLRRTTPRSQGMDYTPGDRFPAESHEMALDTAMLIDQEQDAALANTTNRALLVPDGETSQPLPAASVRANQFAGWDGAGSLVGVSASIGLIGALPLIVTSRVIMSNLLVLGLFDGQMAFLSEGGRAGPFRWTTGNFTARVASDPQQGIYVAHALIGTGTGCFVRSYDGPICADWFGIDMSGATFSDAAFAAAMNFVISQKTSPAYNVGWGRDRLFFPKGIVKLQNPYVAPDLIIGMTISGASKYASVIQFCNDTSDFLTMTGNIGVTIEDISIDHVPISTVRSTWTCAMIARSNLNGGNELNLNRIATRNFAFIDKNTGVGNGDTSRFEHCRFIEPRRVMYGRSSQALLNSMHGCTVFGAVEAMIDVAGYGHMHLADCNIVIAGTWLSLADVSSLWGQTAQFLFVNCKGEPWLYAGDTLAKTRVVSYEGSATFITAHIRMINCGLSSSVALDPTVSQFKVNAAGTLLVEGGSFPLSVLETVSSTLSIATHSRVLFDGLAEAPPPASVVRTGGGGGSNHLPVTWMNCTKLPNMTYALGCGYMHDTVHTNRLANDRSLFLATNSPSSLSLPFYGKRQMIQEVMLHLETKTGGDLTVNAYSDAAKTVLIGTLTVTSAENSTSPVVRRIPAVVDKFVTEGIYFSIACPAVQLGFIDVTHRG